MGHYKRLMRILTTIETIWVNAVLSVSPNWTSQISYNVLALHIHKPSVWAVLTSFDIRMIMDIGPLKAAHAHIDDD